MNFYVKILGLWIDKRLTGESLLMLVVTLLVTEFVSSFNILIIPFVAVVLTGYVVIHRQKSIEYRQNTLVSKNFKTMIANFKTLIQKQEQKIIVQEKQLSKLNLRMERVMNEKKNSATPHDSGDPRSRV